MYDDLKTFFDLKFSQGSGWNSGLISYVVVVLGVTAGVLVIPKMKLLVRIATPIIVAAILSPLFIFPILSARVASKVYFAISSNNAEVKRVDGKIRIYEQGKSDFLVQLDETDYRRVQEIAKKHNHQLPDA